MVVVWALFMLMVFVIEPRTHKRLAARAERDPAAILRRLFRAHIVLLLAMAVAVLGGVAGSPGGFFQ